MHDVTPPSAARSGSERAVGAALILFALSAPWSIAAAQTAIVLTAILVLGSRWLGRHRSPAVPFTVLMFGAYLAVQALSIPLGIHPERSLGAYRGSWVLLFPFVFWPALRDDTTRRRALVALVTSGGLAGAYGILQHFQGRDWLHGGRLLEQFEGGGYLAVGNLSHHLTFAGVMLPILFVAIGLAIDVRGSRRALAALAAAAMGLAVLFTFARSAWLGAAAGLLWLSFGRGWRFGLAITAPAAIAMTAAALLEPSISARLASIADITELPRWRLWQTALRIIADHPVMGAGLGAFPTLFPVYQLPGLYKSTVHPHHDLLNAMVETGVIGGAVWLGIWLTFLRETRRPRPSGRRWSVLGARAGVVALLVGGLGQCYSTDEEVAQVWFFLLTFALVQAGVDTSGGRAPLKRLERWFKSRSLPLARGLFARRKPAAGGRAPRVGEKLLVVRPDDRLGNLLLMTPFLRRLRERHPEARVGMLVGDAFAPLLATWPWVDEWIVQRKREHIRSPWRFVSWARAIRGEDWSTAFEMSNHNTHSYYSCLLTLLSGAPERVGFDEPRNQETLTRAVAAPDERRHFSLAPLALLGEDVPPAPIECPLPAGAEMPAVPGADGPYAIAHVGGRGGKALSGPAWREILARAAGIWTGTTILIAGPGEEDRIPPGARDGGRMVVAPGMDVVSLARLIGGARFYLGCDTGVMHLAVAMRTPTIALFFRSNPWHYAPLGRTHATVLLANPYGVEPSLWEREDAGAARSRLFVAPASGEASRRGVPSVDGAALETVSEALRATLAAPDAALSGGR